MNICDIVYFTSLIIQSDQRTNTSLLALKQTLMNQKCGVSCLHAMPRMNIMRKKNMCVWCVGITIDNYLFAQGQHSSSTLQGLR